jgi:phage baseplate assembly protein W
VKYYYTVPFDTHALIEKQKHPLCSLRDSVEQNINLIIKTHLKEYRFDDNYGCLIWNKDYSTVTNVSNWKDELKSLMLSAIEKNEPRIVKLKIDLSMEEVEFTDKFRDFPLKLKNKITIHIAGIVKHLNEPFEHLEYLFFSPLSIG